MPVNPRILIVWEVKVLSWLYGCISLHDLLLFAKNQSDGLAHLPDRLKAKKRYRVRQYLIELVYKFAAFILGFIGPLIVFLPNSLLFFLLSLNFIGLLPHPFLLLMRSLHALDLLHEFWRLLVQPGLT